MFTNSEIIKSFWNANKNVIKFHQIVCNRFGILQEAVNANSLYSKVLRVITKGKTLKRNNCNQMYQLLMSSEFKVPMISSYKQQKENQDECDKLIKIRKIHEQETLIGKVMSDRNLLKQRLKNINLSRLNQKLKRQQQTIRRHHTQILKLRQKLKDNQKPKSVDKSCQCNTLKDEIDNLNLEVDTLKCGSAKTLTNTFSTRMDTVGKPFKPEIRELYYDLLSLNVGIDNISKVVQKVLALVNIKIDELPCPTTTRHFQTELNVINKQQINESVRNSETLTLHRDATTKKGRHYYGMEVTSESGTLTAALSEVSDGKADTYVHAINNLISDISYCSNNPDFKTCFFEKTKNSMTDRCATESKVTKVLNEQNSTEINSFKCSVHPILQMQEVCEKEIVIMEKEQKDNKLLNDISSVTLLKSVSKLFYKDGTGDPLLASNFIKSQGVKKIPILNFRGNRFNVLFHNAQGSFFLRNYILNYLTSSKSSLNFVQNLIVSGLQNDFILSVIRALGIINTLITEPYMETTMSTNFNSIEIGTVYRMLLEILQTGVNETEKLINNQVYLLIGPRKSTIEKEQCLFESSDLDTMTKEILSRLCKALYEKCNKIFSDYLCEGKFFHPDENIITESRKCPQNNICVERLMGKLDSGLKASPNINCENLESRIMYKGNETGKWLNSKTQEEKESLIQDAMKKRKVIESVHKDRKRELFEKSVEIINERKRKKVETANRKSEKQQTLIDNIERFGSADDESEIEDKLATMKTKKQKISYLKTQINYLKGMVILTGQTKHLTVFSRGGKLLEVLELKENLLKLITIKKQQNTCKLEHPPTLIGKQLLHVWTNENGIDQEYVGKILSYSKGVFEIQYVGHGVFDLSVDDFCEDTKRGTLNLL